MGDRRVERTRSKLRGALVDLLHEKAYDQILIKDITERAGIAYATFFRHFEGRDTLFMALADQFLQDLNEPDGEPSPIDFLFEHVQQHAAVYRSMLSIPNIREHIQTRLIERSLLVCGPLAEPDSLIPVEVLASHVARSQLGLIEWWLEEDMPYPAERMVRIYSTLIEEAAWTAHRSNRLDQ